MSVDRLTRHAQLYGCEGVFDAAVGILTAAELTRLAAILRRRGWRPTKAEQARIDAARSTRSRPHIFEWRSDSGLVPLRPHSDGVLSVADAKSDLALESSGNGATGPLCEGCGRPFEAKRSTRRYCGATCRSRAHRRVVVE